MTVLIACAGLAADAHAQARTIRFTSQSLGGERIFAILLPADYATSDRRYPVVYLFHGGGQDHTAFMARKAFAPLMRRHEVIAVMPAADRNYSAMGTAQTRYHDFVASELIEYVDSNYRTIPSREARAIAGISMGGRIAAMTALSHPQQFAVVGALSAAFRMADVEGVTGVGERALPYVYASCGTADALLPVNRRFAEWLVARKVPHEYREIPGKGHLWDLWDEQLGVFFDMLSKREGWQSTPQR